MRALAPEPDERFPTMQALQIALESFARASGVALSTVALAAFIQELFADELGGVAGGAARGQVAGRAPGGASRWSSRRRIPPSAPRPTRSGPRRRARAVGARDARRRPSPASSRCARSRARWRRSAGERRRGAERRRRARRERSAVGGAGRGKESGNRTDRGKNSAVYDGDSSRRDEPVTRRRRPRPRRRRHQTRRRRPG